MFKRRVARFAAYVVNSTGFMMARLFSGPITPTSPALGTVMNHAASRMEPGRRCHQAAAAARDPSARRPLGRAFDPRVAIIKDTPGPLLIEEIGLEATI
jgi:hypothetical protein